MFFGEPLTNSIKYGGGGIYRIFEILSFIIGSNAISSKAEIGFGTIFYHRGVGCVVHERTVIGENCHIFQNVTLGSKWPNGVCEGKAPRIGNNVFIGAGAVVLGDIDIGNNVIIGANAVVTKSVPQGCFAVGIPARVSIKKEVKNDSTRI